MIDVTWWIVQWSDLEDDGPYVFSDPEMARRFAAAHEGSVISVVRLIDRTDGVQ